MQPFLLPSLLPDAVVAPAGEIGIARSYVAATDRSRARVRFRAPHRAWVQVVRVVVFIGVPDMRMADASVAATARSRLLVPRVPSGVLHVCA